MLCVVTSGLRTLQAIKIVAALPLSAMQVFAVFEFVRALHKDHAVLEPEGRRERIWLRLQVIWALRLPHTKGAQIFRDMLSNGERCLTGTLLWLRLVLTLTIGPLTCPLPPSARCVALMPSHDGSTRPAKRIAASAGNDRSCYLKAAWQFAYCFPPNKLPFAICFAGNVSSSCIPFSQPDYSCCLPIAPERRVHETRTKNPMNSKAARFDRLFDG